MTFFRVTLGLFIILGAVACCTLAPASRARAIQQPHATPQRPSPTGEASARAPGASRAYFVDIAPDAGLDAFVVAGSEQHKKYLTETTGSGVAFIDYDNDGLPDIFIVNGARPDPAPGIAAPRNYMFHNVGGGKFRDVTRAAGLMHSGWGQGVCAGDFDNDGFVDLFVTYWGHNVLYRNNGDGTFSDTTRKAGRWSDEARWSTGCSSLDYDHDGRLDLFVANYVDFDPATVPQPGANRYCMWKGTPVVCGPRGLQAARSALYHNRGDGTFSDVSGQSGVSRPPGRYALGVLTSDFNNDGWVGVYVACDSTPNLLFLNNHDGTFTEAGVRAGVAYNEDGNEQAGMGVDAADYDGDSRLDIVKTNFADDTATLYRNGGDGTFRDASFAAGLGHNTRFLGWGVAFVDFDQDTWPDLFLANGHVYPEVEATDPDTGYRQRKVVYWNQGNGKFADISMSAGPGVLVKKSSRGLAVADIDNDGSPEILVNNMEDRPQLFRNTASKGNWLLVKTIGTKSNRDGIGARVTVITGSRRQVKEVKSGGNYISQSDFRLHFGLGSAARADRVEIRWPSGLEDAYTDAPANRVLTVREGAGTKKAAGRPRDPLFQYGRISIVRNNSLLRSSPAF